MRRIFLSMVFGIMALGFLTACGKGYIVTTEKDPKGGTMKVVHSSAVDNSNWHWLFGSDITVEMALLCKPEAINWKGDLDKEQCSGQHNHLAGSDKGMTHYVRTVHASDTIIKKAVSGLWALLFFIPNLVGSHGDQNVTQSNANVNNAAFYDGIPPNGGHAVIK